MKYFLWLLALFATVVPAPAANPDPPFSDPYLYEIIRHLYRWEMDETTVLRVSPNGNLDVWTRDLDPPLDPGDASHYREIFFPQFQMDVIVKKADYLISELGQRVQNRDYMIESVTKTPTPLADASAYQQRTLKTKDILDYLARTRGQLDYPDQPLMERLRLALRAAKTASTSQPLVGVQTVYVAPLSPVSNNIWVFWETQGWLIKFSSDSDISNPLFWEMEKLGVQVYNLHTDIVVSLNEVQGSHAYVTRDWAARAIFNCVVFGQRIEVTPSNSAAPATFKVVPHPKGV